MCKVLDGRHCNAKRGQDLETRDRVCRRDLRFDHRGWSWWVSTNARRAEESFLRSLEVIFKSILMAPILLFIRAIIKIDRLPGFVGTGVLCAIPLPFLVIPSVLVDLVNFKSFSGMLILPLFWMSVVAMPMSILAVLPIFLLRNEFLIRRNYDGQNGILFKFCCQYREKLIKMANGEVGRF